MRVLLVVFFVGLSFFIVDYANARSEAEVVQTVTDDYLAAHQDKLDGSRLRFHGFINECSGWNCFVCPDWKSVSEAHGCWMLLNWADWKASPLMDELYRFTEVTLSGKFSVFRVPPGMEVDCFSNRGCWTGFEDVKIEELTSRRTTAELQESGPDDALDVLSAKDDSEVRAIFDGDKFFHAYGVVNDHSNIRTFRHRFTSYIENWLCMRKQWDSTDVDAKVEQKAWPKKYADVHSRYPGSPYVCWSATQDDDGSWSIRHEAMSLLRIE